MASESPPSVSGMSPKSFYSDESFSEVSPSELSDVTPQAAGPDEGFVPLEEDLDIGLLNELTLTDEAKKIVYGCSGDLTSSEYQTSDASGLTSPNDSETCALLPNRPEQLFISRGMLRRRGSSTSNSSYNSDSIIENLDSVLQAVSETPLHGTMTKKDGMISFIAEDLEEMIRMSSPASRGSQTPSNRSMSSASSVTSSYCGSSFSGMSRSSSMPLQPSPDDMPAIDPYAIKDLETHAKRVADNLDLLMGNLKSNLHKMTSLTKGCLSIYAEGIENTCDSVDASIKAMYALMAKSEEVSKGMRPIYKIADQIKEIKRLLDLFEAQVAKDVKEEKR